MRAQLFSDESVFFLFSSRAKQLPYKVMICRLPLPRDLDDVTAEVERRRRQKNGGGGDDDDVRALEGGGDGEGEILASM